MRRIPGFSGSDGFDSIQLGYELEEEEDMADDWVPPVSEMEEREGTSAAVLGRPT
jgi:hypothetical protein